MSIQDKLSELDLQNLPNHVAVIMDGNGRWAKKHHKKRIFGHQEGVKAIRKIVEISGQIGLQYLTLYAFSTENWGRSKTEVSYLLKLIMDSLLREIDELIRSNVNIRFIGSERKLNDNYQKQVYETCRRSWENDGLHLNIAMNYGGRQELLEAFGKIYDKIKSGTISSPIDEKMIEQHLYTAGMPQVDLIIRTSGEERLSNFLLWQSAYAELWFTRTLWPDFDKTDFLQALIDYQSRKRRFGKR
jgi:undecaprenyl diphosphate synthase